jgi:hypothetical protein
MAYREWTPWNQGNFRCYLKCSWFCQGEASWPGFATIRGDSKGIGRPFQGMCSDVQRKSSELQNRPTRSILQGAMHCHASQSQTSTFPHYVSTLNALLSPRRTQSMLENVQSRRSSPCLWTWLAAVPATNSWMQTTINFCGLENSDRCMLLLYFQRKLVLAVISSLQRRRWSYGRTAMLVAGSTLKGRIIR